MKITAERLRELVSEDQMKIFEKEWPEGMEVTKANCLRAVEIKLDIGWMAKNLLSPAALAEYVKLTDASREEYDKLTDAAVTEYVKLTDASREEYDKALALAFWKGSPVSGKELIVEKKYVGSLGTFDGDILQIEDDMGYVYILERRDDRTITLTNDEAFRLAKLLMSAVGVDYDEIEKSAAVEPRR